MSGWFSLFTEVSLIASTVFALLGGLVFRWHRRHLNLSARGSYLEYFDLIFGVTFLQILGGGIGALVGQSPGALANVQLLQLFAAIGGGLAGFLLTRRLLIVDRMIRRVRWLIGYEETNSPQDQ